MDAVMINQLPELVIPRNRTFTPVNKMTVADSMEKRNPYITKWYVLFDNKNDQWISFQPQVGHIVYPCYACRDMFGSRNSFLDHVNRRGLVLKYRCTMCKKLITFYNTCSFLLHARDHFPESGGTIDLENVEISTIPMDIAGFIPIPNVPRLYDSEDDSMNDTLKISVKFFKPLDECVGKRIVNFVPNDLVFFCSMHNNNQAMIVKQMNEKIPKCIFIPMVTNEEIPKNEILPHNSDNESDVLSEDESDVICLDDEDSHLTSDEISSKSNQIHPKIQVKNLNSLVTKQHLTSDEEFMQISNEIEVEASQMSCPECNIQQDVLSHHFQENNKPFDDNFKCKICGLISTSGCSLQAHIRIHEKRSPFICPECGKTFESWTELYSHMDYVCFHSAKTVRFKCPAKKCGKIFAQTVTFSSHFPVAHMKVKFGCNSCTELFINEVEHEQHVESHENATDKSCFKVHECTVCSAPTKDIKEHVLNHVQDKENRIYVFICKYCRSYYRSKLTYAAHLLKCSKLLLNNQVKQEVQRIESHNDMKCKVIKFCKPCYCKIQFHCTYKDIKHVASCCPQCSTPFSNDVATKNKNYFDYEFTQSSFVRKNVESNSFVCILCNEILDNIDESFNYDKHFCKYKNPIVVLGLVDNISHNLDDQQDSNKKKRKRFLNGNMKNKRNPADKSSENILAVNPVPFDGEYKCKFCEFKNESRKLFHDHIQEHRDISTCYQCMECGECFVVKPSLMKHLQVFHLVENVDSYLKENECYDKEAVRILEEHMRMVPGEVNEPVAENQCKICRQFFSDTQELSKHFRVHGMAFLLKKIIK